MAGSGQVFECLEPHGRPARRAVPLEDGQEVAVYGLDHDPGAPVGLRRTVLRRADENPPSGARLVAWLRADGGVLTVVETGREVHVELARAGQRAQVVAGMRLPPGATLELTLADESRVSLSVGLRRAQERGAAMGVGGSGTRRSRVRYGTDNVWWLFTDAPDLLIGLYQKSWDGLRARMGKLGVDSRVATFLAGFAVAGVAMGAAAVQRHLAAAAATERADTAETALARAESAQAAALATELACLEQRQALALQVGEADEERRLAAESALALPLARTAAVEVGGPRLSGAAVVEIDQLYLPNLVNAVVARLGAAKGDAAPCLAQEAALGKDLPRYLLLWHPDPRLTCPSPYDSAEGGVRKVGRYGLSDRLAREFGAGGDAGTGLAEQALREIVGDPRVEDRWAAFTSAVAFRTVLSELLDDDLSPRPPALPSQVQAWALALLDGYNRMPSPADGALDEDLRTCVRRLLVEQAGRAPAVGGEPLLPDLALVASGDAVIATTPTPGCPWPRDALRDGADAALRAAARLADAGGR